MKSNANERPPASGGDLADAIAQAASHPSLPAGLANIYRAVDAEVQGLDATCMGGGVCCRFDIVDHRLYATTAEVAYLLAGGPPPQAAQPGRCPYQVGPRCTARERRPLGCRIYFCCPQAGEATHALYGRFHELICCLHNELGIDYQYVELTGALAGLAAGPITPSCGR